RFLHFPVPSLLSSVLPSLSYLAHPLPPFSLSLPPPLSLCLSLYLALSLSRPVSFSLYFSLSLSLSPSLLWANKVTCRPESPGAISRREASDWQASGNQHAGER